MILSSILVFTTLPTLVFGSNNARLGNLHTSTAFIGPLVSVEERIVDLLDTYVHQERARLDRVSEYIEEWKSTDTNSYTENPLASYQLFKRIVYDYEQVEKNIFGNYSHRVLEKLKAIKSAQPEVPTESDVNGVRWALVHLQDVYDLPIDTFVKGYIREARKTKELSVEDCFKFGEESFKNLAFNLSDKWTQKAIQMLGREGPLSKESHTRIHEARDSIVKRRMMRELVTTMAQKTDRKVYDHFSGLGVPKSFEKEVYDDRKQGEQIEAVQEVYKKLCRGKAMQSQTNPKDLYCHYSFAMFQSHPIYPFKIERLSSDPEIAIYHDVLSEAEINQIQELSFPILKTAQVKAYAKISNMKSIARIGKSAWLHRTQYPLVERLLQKVSSMTGLSTKHADDIHVLNYGVGGHYELHIDFFDFANRIQTQNSSDYRGDQVATVLFYLNDVTFGGSTVFPYVNIEVKPVRGSVLVWYNLYRNGKGNFKTIHASCPILLGQKWIATLWLNERGQEFIRPCLLDSTQ